MADMALFWGEGDEVDPDSADMAALMALQEECTPEERAEAYKARDVLLRPADDACACVCA
jgi:hypothetical protein